MDETRGVTRRATRNLVDAAISNEVDLVVLAGDIFDGEWKDYGTGLYWISELARLRDADIPVVLASGNHDAASEISRQMTLPPNVTQLSTTSPQTVTFDDLDVAVVGQGYPSRRVDVNLAEGCPVGDPGLFTIDRLTHRCRIIETKGDSYRLHDAKTRTCRAPHGQPSVEGPVGPQGQRAATTVLLRRRL